MRHARNTAKSPATAMISPSEPPTRPMTRPKPSRQQDAVPNQPQNAIKLPTGEKSGLAEQVLDGVVNHGRKNGIVQLQEALNKVLKGNLDPDGKLGRRTEKAIQEAIKQGRLTELGKQLVKERQDFIDKSPKIRAREKPVLKRRVQEVGPK